MQRGRKLVEMKKGKIRDEFGQYVTFMYENVIINPMLFTTYIH